MHTSNISFRQFLTMCSVVITLFLTGCSSFEIARPFEQIITDPKADNYLVVVTFTEYRDQASAEDNFDHLVDEIVENMQQVDGLVGYSVRKDLFQNRAWTYTIWQKADDINQFKTSGAHLKAMIAAPKLLDTATFARTTISAEQLPYSWEEALSLLSENGRTYNF